jgi:hypothetical protein
MTFDLYEYETDAAGAGEGGGTGDGADTLDAGDAVATDDIVTEAEVSDAQEAMEPDYSEIFGRPEFRQSLAEAVQEGLGGLFQGQQEGFYPADEQALDFADLDPITDPQGYAQAIVEAAARENARVIQQLIAPYQPALEATAHERWEQETDEYYGRLEQEHGQADHKLARHLANGIANLSGGSERDPHGTAYRELADYVKTQRADAVEEYKKSLLNRDSTPYEPGISGGGTPGAEKPRDEVAAALGWANRQNAGLGV